MNLIPFQAIYPNLGLIASEESFFGTVKSQFPEYMQSGFFKRSSQESIYVYELETPRGSHKGIISCADINDFLSERVLKHENTLAAKEQQMMNIMLQNKAMVKPVLLAYESIPEINKVIHKVMKSEELFFQVKFQTTGETHSIWQISNGDMVNRLSNLFRSKVPNTYIADGHHRVKTSILLHQRDDQNEVLDTKLNSVLCVFFSWDQLSIFDYNRCIEIFQSISPLHFMASISRVCSIKPIKGPVKPKRKHEMTMVLYGEWYRLRWKRSVIKKHNEDTVIFDAHLLNEYVLKEIMGMTNIREDVRIKYLDGVAGAEGIEEMVAKNENRVGFCLYPIEATDVQKIADENLTLPPKSTWFEPRVKNGLIVKEF